MFLTSFLELFALLNIASYIFFILIFTPKNSIAEDPYPRYQYERNKAITQGYTLGSTSVWEITEKITRSKNLRRCNGKEGNQSKTQGF
jgi:hypothetical protein